MAVVAAIVGTVAYITAKPEPKLDTATYAPGELIDIPNEYRQDGMVLWGKPTNVDLADVGCHVVYTTREKKLPVGPNEIDQDIAQYSDSNHGDVAYLASTASVIGLPSSAACEGGSLTQVLVSVDRDVEGSKGTGNLALASSVFFLLFGAALRVHLRSLRNGATTVRGRTAK